jgi:DNA-binding GntR family transcriptional regulator
MTVLKLARSPSLVSLVFDELERMIMEGALKPGDPINEKALSDSNGLSRAPIREACRRLEQAGLVEIIPNRGVFVRRISRRSAEELCEIKVVLARHLNRLIFASITSAQLAALRALVAKIEAQARSRNLPRYYALNEEFHHSLVDIGGNQRLSEIYKAINKELNLFRWRAFREAPALEDSMSAHQEIIAALADRDEALFCQVMEEHLLATNQRILSKETDDEPAASPRWTSAER